ncbi:MAG: hypothetical protein H0X33_00305 [Taibaiella sp.]|nr:hypothetical protein [Taibaiella sp.]
MKGGITILLLTVSFAATAQYQSIPIVYREQLSAPQPTLFFVQPLINVTTSQPAGIAPDNYVKGFGFFCKRELELEHIAHTPVHIRVGSQDDCDRLEQKNGHKNLYR